MSEMVSKEETNGATNKHPAEELKIGNEDQINSLMKLHPITLPSENIIDQEVVETRSSYKYLYLINWLYNCRGFLKLSSEHFDVDLFEIELLNLVYPPPIEETVLFVNKLKISLITTLQNSKLSSLNNFEKIFRLWFGIETPLKGNEDEDDTTPNPRFDDLKFGDKIEILYILVHYISQYSQFRTWIDKNAITTDILRINSIYADHVSKGTTEEYFLMFDNSRLYKRIITFPFLQIPKKRKLAPESPDAFYDPELFDISNIKFELIFKNIYEYNKYSLEIKKKKLKRNKAIFSKLNDKEAIDVVFQTEIKKRKILTNRRREMQLANLLATRKRSSRLEAKEKQKQEEMRMIKLQEEAEMKIASEKRLERRRLAKEQLFQPKNMSSSTSREERLKIRKLNILPDSISNGNIDTREGSDEFSEIDPNAQNDGPDIDQSAETTNVSVELKNENVTQEQLPKPDFTQEKPDSNVTILQNE